MRGAGDHRDLLALELFGPQFGARQALARHEARRQPVIRIAEIQQLARLRRHRDRGDHRLAAILVERRHQRIEAAHLDGAGDLQLLADQPREIDIEAGRMPSGPA